MIYHIYTTRDHDHDPALEFMVEFASKNPQLVHICLVFHESDHWEEFEAMVGRRFCHPFKHFNMVFKALKRQARKLSPVPSKIVLSYGVSMQTAQRLITATKDIPRMCQIIYTPHGQPIPEASVSQCIDEFSCPLPKTIPQLATQRQLNYRC